MYLHAITFHDSQTANVQTAPTTVAPPICINFDSKFALPDEGDFKLVTYDIMTTGPSLSDDLCSIVAYCPVEEKSFSQHIMPYNNLSLGACRRYSLRIVSSGRYRVLKDVRNNKVKIAPVQNLKYVRKCISHSNLCISLRHLKCQKFPLNVNSYH